MFTLNIYLRFALIGLLLIGGTILSITISFWYALPLLLIGIALLVGYFLLGTIQSAAQMMQEHKFVEAEQRLGLTWKPNWLYSANRAYYYLIKGTIAMNLQRPDEAEDHFNRAQSIGLPSDNEKAMVSLQLAGIYAQKNNWKSAQNHFTAAKKLNITEPTIKEQMVEFEKGFKQRGQLKHARSGMMSAGGKRRRPKMR